MRLRRLETFGFKSFADRMTFDFEDGITAVIGPNGCGKSNIVDSIKWVIGEQSAKALRGEEMTDVIFNGCATRKSMALCEVTLVLDQVGDRLGIDGDEVAITRRLFRDGTSGYYLNGKACRLKDIKELFMDTGVGTSAYSVIEQGRVGFILESNTKDRRAILEEAAGISRYKSRRKVALRKLERVSLDLQRIAEVLSEVKRRVRAVSRQAEAALKFRELSGQAKELRMAFALEEFGRLSQELSEHAGRKDELDARLAEVSAQLGTLEASLSESEVGLVAFEDEIRAGEQVRADAQSRRDVADARAKDAKYRQAEVDQQEGDDRKALEALAAKLAAARAEHETAEAALRSVESGAPDASLGEAMRERREELDRAIAEVDAVIKEIEDAKAKQVECLRELSRVEAEQSRLGLARNATADRRGRLEERTGGQSNALLEARQAESQARASLEALIGNAAGAHSALDEHIRARETALAEGSRLDNELNEVRHQEARAETGLRLLQEQERRAEGVFRGVRDVLQQMDRFPGLLGMVAELCRVPDHLVVAIETALGGSAQNIVTETQEAARQAIAFLKQERRGRATFLPLDDIQGGERVDERMLREPGVVGIASRLVDYESRFRPAFEFLLGNVLVVETLEQAIAIRRGHRHERCRMVTLEGDVIAPGGAMTGGRQQGAEAGGIVSRKNEIAKLSEQMSEIAVKKKSAGEARDVAKKLGFDLGMKVEEQRRAIQAADRAVGEAKAQLMKAERDRLHLEEATASFGAELEEIAAELGRIEAEGKELAGQREWFSALSRRLEEDVTRLQAKLESRASSRNRAQEEVNNLRVSLATTQERQEAARNHLMHLVRSLQELEDARAEREHRLSSHALKRAELASTRTENERAFASESEQVVAAAKRLEGLIRDRDQLRNGLEERRQEARSLSAKQRTCEQERGQAELKANEATVRIETTSQRILDEFQIDLAEAYANYQRPADLDWPALRNRLAEVEKELAALGPVNLAAIDELEEVKAREEFLDQQHTDLSNAAQKLTEIIENINQVSRKLFETTYKDVRANFQALFRKLFGGGRADLELEKKDELGNPVDVLEAGLEIVAQPPGKNPKIITQLSGGEKALTAIALLFAVYQTKPSPFCILDEVDAPLDESNVDVYNSMLREFTRGNTADGVQGSQFIVITHKKRTMQRADAIYGITQNEPGVSTKISVKFEDVDAVGGGELAPTTRGAGPYTG
jgi:chromosome segregation protein